MNRIKKAIRVIKSCNPKITNLQWRILLAVAQDPGSSITHLVSKGLIKGNPSDVSMSVCRLAGGRQDRSGLGLIIKRLNPNDRRNLQLYLSDRGKECLEQFLMSL